MTATREGVVEMVRGGVYRVALDDGTEAVEASLRGRLKQEARGGDRVVVGDRVRVAVPATGGDDDWTIEEILERERALVRARPGGRPKVIAANVDHLIVVVAVARPDPRTELIDRLLVVGESCEVPPVVVLNKVDLEGVGEVVEDLAALYTGAGYPVHRVSAQTGEGIERLLDEVLCAGTSALVGPSGAGKSSILNRAQPGLSLRVGEVSRKIGRGTHTTVSSRLLRLECGGRVADTPGFSDVGLWQVEPEGLDRCFPEFIDGLDDCRFRDCHHRSEPGCAVLAAVEAGEIDPRRHASYLALREEAEEAARDW